MQPRVQSLLNHVWVGVWTAHWEAGVIQKFWIQNSEFGFSGSRPPGFGDSAKFWIQNSEFGFSGSRAPGFGNSELWIPNSEFEIQNFWVRTFWIRNYEF